MIKALHPLVLAIVLLFSNVTLAQDNSPEQVTKYYDVEIIVFRNDNVPRSHELNLPTPSATVAENALDLSSPESIQLATARGYTALKPEELHLLDKVTGIIQSSRYSLLLHTGWRQPGNDEKNSIPVWIKGGRVYSDGYSSIDQFRDINTVTNSNPLPDNSLSPSPITENRPTNPKGLYELEGQITVTLSRYLHTNAELVLRKPATPVELLEQTSDSSLLDEAQVIEGQLLLNYSLKEKRRMRSRKLHYLDSPEFGMLVLITPYEAPASTIQQQPVNDSAPVTPEQALDNKPVVN